MLTCCFKSVKQYANRTLLALATTVLRLTAGSVTARQSARAGTDPSLQRPRFASAGDIFAAAGIGSILQS